jgi:chromate reductase
MPTIAVIVGSLRRESINRQLAQALIKLGQGKLDMQLLDIADLPLYNEDLWKPTPPEAVTRLKSTVAAADGVLFVTPEYNRSFTPVIKNVIDWGSRPYGHNAWAGKPAAMAGTTTGAIGTAVAQGALRSLLGVVDTRLMHQPEVYLTWKEGLVDPATHAITNPDTEKFLAKWVDKFAGWVAQHAKVG